jgi:Pentapeptide repeats (8 copies)
MVMPTSNSNNNPPEDWTEKNMQGEDLSFRNLKNYTLKRTNFNGTDFSNADLSGTNCQKSKMRGVILNKTLLRGADLSSADLSGADLCGADLRGSILSCTDLTDANLIDANLIGANVRYAKFIRCQGLDLSAIEDLKQRGAIMDNSSNLSPPGKSELVEHRKWWMQFVIVPVAIALIAGIFTMVATSKSQNQVVPSSSSTQQK